MRKLAANPIPARRRGASFLGAALSVRLGAALSVRNVSNRSNRDASVLLPGNCKKCQEESLSEMQQSRLTKRCSMDAEQSEASRPI